MFSLRSLQRNFINEVFFIRRNEFKVIYVIDYDKKALNETVEPDSILVMEANMFTVVELRGRKDQFAKIYFECPLNLFKKRNGCIHILLPSFNT